MTVADLSARSHLLYSASKVMASAYRKGAQSRLDGGHGTNPYRDRGHGGFATGCHRAWWHGWRDVDAGRVR